MDRFNLNVYVEQVNHEVDDTPTDKWEENEEQALCNVIDPNTEFKTPGIGKSTSVTPLNSYGLTNETKALGQKKTPVETQNLQERNSSREIIQLQAECLDRELEESLEGHRNRRTRSVPDTSLVAKVHAYSASCLPSQPENSIIEMDPEAMLQSNAQNKLLKYPPDRITVVTEKCSYLTKSPSKTKAVDIHQRHMSTPVKERLQSVATDSPLSGASSQESISTASIASGHLHRKSSLTSNHSLSNMASETSCRLNRSMTTADQLAWEFRRARERLDTASNISGCSSRFELDSNYSERAETMSTISDVSGYEEEMFRIKRLLLLDSSTPTPPSANYSKIKDHIITPPINKTEVSTTPKENIEIQMHRLAVQLQNALTEKEKYKTEAASVEAKVALEWQEKHQEVLRQKAHLEGRLETIQTEMSSLASEQKEILERNRSLEHELKSCNASESKTALQEMERLVLEISKLQQTIREVENKNEDLAVQLELKDSEIKQWKGEVKTSEDMNEKLRIELQELKVESESKDGAIQGLKSKISDQHVEFQSLLQAKLKAENNIASLKNEVESVKKSGYWYRDQLHACQAAKVKVQQELMSSQASTVSQSHQIEKQKSEITGLKQLVEETQHRAVREKEALMRKLEVIQADILERETTIFSQIHNEATTDTINTIASKLKKIEEEKNKMINISDAAVQELKEEVMSLKSELLAKESSLETALTENSQLMVRTTTLQKTLNDKELALQLLENKCKNIEMSHNHLAENLKAKEHSLLELKNEKVSVEVALAAAGKEKTEVDAAIGKLREDFARITSSYQAMKTELREKDKHVVNLKTDINKLQKEKQNLMEKIGELCKVQDDYRVLQGRMAQTEVLEQQVEQLNKLNRELNMKISELTEINTYVKDESNKMSEKLTAREVQLMNQTKNFEVHREELKTKEHALVEIQKVKDYLEQFIKNLQTRIKELEASSKKSADEVVSLKKQLSRANGAIEQFNLLCRKSEEEKCELEKKMKQLLEKEKQEENMIKVLEPPTKNGSILSTENIKVENSSFELSSKVVPQFENGYLQTNSVKLYDLIQKTEYKLLSLLSETCKENQIEKEKAAESPRVIEFDSILSPLVNIDDCLNKALSWKDQLLTEIKTEKEVNEELKNELSKLREGLGIVPSSQEKVSNISCETQTDRVHIDNTGTQTINDDAVKYKEQVEFYLKEISRLKVSLKMSEIENREKHRRYETNVRTLLKKVKEHMRGRKAAEQTLEELRQKTEANPDIIRLKSEIENLQAQLEASQNQYEEQRKLAEKNQEAMLELERERGKLAQSCSISHTKPVMLSHLEEDDDATVNNEFDHKTRELQFLQIQKKVSELEEEIHKLHIINKELRKEIFTEKCETSLLRKQVASLQMGLDTANDMLDTKKVELGRSESLCCVLRTNINHLKKQLEDEQQAHEECKQDVERLRESLEETKAKDPVLADQIKTLSYHLHQKTQEAAGLQEKLRLSEERWTTIESGLQRNLSALQEELSALRSELDSVRADKFTLQTQSAELRAALQSSVEQNKVLRLKLETFGCENKDRLPDLTSSLPLPPTKYDETRIAELLHQSTALPHNKPLNNLQCCLDSLKQEMAVLQMQIAAKTSPRDQKDGEPKREQSDIKEI